MEPPATAVSPSTARHVTRPVRAVTPLPWRPEKYVPYAPPPSGFDAASMLNDRAAGMQNGVAPSLHAGPKIPPPASRSC